MTIYKLQATFGKLKGETLELHEGLNILTLPNEAGKSTWCAFLLAMLYGIDTAERATKNAMPDKVRYKPWSGAAMEGRMDTEWNGRKITIERSSKGRVPMGAFRAYETESGLPVDALTAENCGEMLLGVPRSVFERSAFVRQAGMAVSQDDALENRLMALVTAGEETVSYQQTAKRLHDAKNRLKHNKTGLIPQTERELADAEAALSAVHAIRREELPLKARQQTLSAKQKELDTALSALEAIENNRKLEKRDLAEEELHAAERELAAAETLTEKLPRRDVLETLADQLAALRPPETDQVSPLPAEPDCPAVFRETPEEKIMEKARLDGQAFDKLTAARHQPAALFWLFAALCAVGGVCFALAGKWALAAVWAAGLLLFIAAAVQAVRANRKREADLGQADKILDAYERRSRDEFTAYAAEYREKRLLWRQESARIQEENEEILRQRELYASKKERLLGSVNMFAPARTVDEARSAAATALTVYDTAESRRQSVMVARSRLEAISAAMGDVKRVPVPAGDWSKYDQNRCRWEREETRRSLHALSEQLALGRGRIEGYGDVASLEAEKERLTARLAALQARYDALELAEKTLEMANGEISTRFSPQIAAETGSIFAALTGKKYDRVVLGREMDISAGEQDGTVLRQIRGLSGGTADQLYLAVRLAICHLALGTGVPIVLDDALVMFDDERLKTALELLKAESEKRQILLFSCRTRERELAGE